MNDRRSTVQNGQKLPLVSVIMPTKDRPHFLGEALQSISGQTYHDLEVIVIDDGKKDVSAVVDRYREKFRIVYLKTGRGRGPSAARNMGLKSACGKYIAYLDDDDIYYPDHLETLVAYLEENKCEVAYSNAYQAFQKWDGSGFVTSEKRPCGRDFDRQSFLVKDYIPILTVMHRKDCLSETGVFDEGLRVHEDWDLFIRMSRRFDFHHINTATAEFRTREGADSITSKDFPMFLEVMKKIHSRYSRYVSDPKTEKAQKTIVRLSETKIEQQNYVRMNAIKAVSDGDVINSGVSVVIALRNGDEDFKKLAERIMSQKKVRDLEMVVIAEDPDCVPFPAEENGISIVRLACNVNDYGRALNKAVAACRGDYIVFADQSAVPSGNYWLYSMVRPFREHPELAALSCRQVVGPEADLFSLWTGRSREQSPYYKTDSICLLADGPKGTRWMLFEEEIKKRLTFFNVRSSCVRKDVLDEINFSGLTDPEEVSVDFGVRLLEKRKSVGYLVSAGVFYRREESAGELLNRSYYRTRKLRNFMNGLPGFFYINNLGPEDVRSNISTLYHLLNAATAGMKETGPGPLNAARSFVDSLRKNMDGPARRDEIADRPLGELLDRVTGTEHADAPGAENLKNNFLLPHFMRRFERFSDYLCTVPNDSDRRQGEFIPCIYKIFAELAGEVLGAYSLEADEINDSPEDAEQMERTLIK